MKIKIVLAIAVSLLTAYSCNNGAENKKGNVAELKANLEKLKNKR